jgi:fumarate reductase subunit D
MRRSNEPLFWSLFSAGGMLTALLAPAVILVTGFLVAGGDISFSRLHSMFTNWIGRIVLLAIASLTFFHWAHRTRHLLVDLGLREFGVPLAVVCYLTAVAGTVVAGVVVFT